MFIKFLETHFDWALNTGLSQYIEGEQLILSRVFETPGNEIYIWSPEEEDK